MYNTLSKRARCHHGIDGGSHWTYAYAFIIIIIVFMALLLMNIFIAVVSEVYAKATQSAFEDFHLLVDEEIMHEISRITVHVSEDIEKTMKSSSTDMSLSAAIKKTIRHASISSVNRTKEKERSLGESAEETLRRVLPEVLAPMEERTGETLSQVKLLQLEKKQS